MTRTSAEKYADLAREQMRREVMVPVYVSVTGTPSDAEDETVLGVYAVLVDPDLAAMEGGRIRTAASLILTSF